MKMDKDDIEQTMAHQRKMLRVLRDRLQQRELQEAQYGINAPPEVARELYELTERIQRHEAELARLQTEAAVDKEPLAEVEYRATLAEVWDTPRGRPTVAGAARLELTRLRLGVSAERAKTLEREIRAALAEETLFDLKFYTLDPPSVSDKAGFERVETIEIQFGRLVETSRVIGRAIRLDPDITLRLILAVPYYARKLTTGLPGRILLDANNVWIRPDDQALFQRFLADLEAAIAAMPPSRKQATDATDAPK